MKPWVRPKGADFLYVIGPQDFSTGLLKIGRSYNPVTRCKLLQAGSPIPLAIHYAWQFEEDRFSREAETAAHVNFDEHHSHGEWFRLSLGKIVGWADGWGYRHGNQFRMIPIGAIPHEPIQKKRGPEANAARNKNRAARIMTHIELNGL